MTDFEERPTVRAGKNCEPAECIEDFLQDGIDQLENSKFDYFMVAFRPGTTGCNAAFKVGDASLDHLKICIKDTLEMLEGALND